MLLKSHEEKVDISAYLVEKAEVLTADAAESWRVLQDPFGGLPVELRERIFELLPIKDFSALRAASYPMYNTPASRQLWKGIFSSAMPWLWEMEELLTKGNEVERLSLCLTYGELERRSTFQDDLDQLNLTLANRRRVWSVCEMISKKYASILGRHPGSDRRWARRDDGCFELVILSLL